MLRINGLGSVLSPAPWASCDLVACFIFSIEVSVATFRLPQEAPCLQGCGSGSPAQGCLQLAQEMGVVGGHSLGPLGFALGGLFPQVEARGLQVSWLQWVGGRWGGKGRKSLLGSEEA